MNTTNLLPQMVHLWDPIYMIFTVYSWHVKFLKKPDLELVRNLPSGFYSQGLEILMLIREKRKIKITHHYHYEQISLKYSYTYL